MRTVIGVLVFAGCLNSYAPPPERQATTTPSPAPANGGGGMGSGGTTTTTTTSGGTSGGGTTGSGTTGGGTTGGGTTGGQPAMPSCADLADCCQQLPADYAAQCDAALQQVSDDICAAILDQLQQAGVCP